MLVKEYKEWDFFITLCKGQTILVFFYFLYYFNKYKEMCIRVTTLVENCVKGRGVKAEHGLSMRFEDGDNVLLFDTGASDLFIDNETSAICNIVGGLMRQYLQCIRGP